MDHQSKKEKASDRILDLSARNDVFRIISREKIKKVIRYRTYRPGVMSFGSLVVKKKKQVIRYQTYLPGVMSYGSSAEKRKSM